MLVVLFLIISLRTAFVIAHRFSTILHVDKIVVIGNGGNLEQRNQDILMAKDVKDETIEQVESPLNLYNKPVSKFVGGFIGSPAIKLSLSHRNQLNA